MDIIFSVLEMTGGKEHQLFFTRITAHFSICDGQHKIKEKFGVNQSVAPLFEATECCL